MDKVFKTLGEPTRLKILRLLAERELCVCDLEEVMQISQPRISQHLKVLRQAGLVNERREAQRRMLSINREGYEKVWNEFLKFMATPLEQIADLSVEAVRIGQLDGKSCERKLIQINCVDNSGK
ncbi:MAG: metalloregulator ArsR/SmtB family transcription factor [Syntrophomonadaceae bacterium]|nr:metalloregulator ArsR/SmtB family transcription factor [Syntrophomonadaceae bacterium]